jgi:hypothetical protein
VVKVCKLQSRAPDSGRTLTGWSIRSCARFASFLRPDLLALALQLTAGGHDVAAARGPHRACVARAIDDLGEALDRVPLAVLILRAGPQVERNEITPGGCSAATVMEVWYGIHLCLPHEPITDWRISTEFIFAFQVQHQNRAPT